MKTAYITTSFTTLSHTFIRREVAELRKLSMELPLYGIRPEVAKELSGKDKLFADETFYLYPLKIFQIIWANFYFAFTKPLNYFKTFINALLNEETNPFQHLRLIYHFLVSPYMALNMQKKKTKHIHAHFLNVAATIAMYCAQLLGIPFSITVHSAGIAPLHAMIGLKSKLKKAKFICTMSNYNKEYIDTIYPCKQKTYIIRYGIDVNRYIGKIDHSSLREKDKIKLLSIGRFEEKKGFKYLVEAAKLLKEKNIIFKLTMVGDGPLKPKIENMANGYHLNENVVLKGSLSPEAVKEEFDKCDMLIVPSVVSSTGEKEGMPVVIIEAMAMGVPVITTRHSGIPEIVKDKETGLLAPEKDPLPIVQAIKLLSEDEVLRKTCINNARKIVSEEFNIKETTKIKEKIFKENT